MESHDWEEDKKTNQVLEWELTIAWNLVEKSLMNFARMKILRDIA